MNKFVSGAVVLSLIAHPAFGQAIGGYVPPTGTGTVTSAGVGAIAGITTSGGAVTTSGVVSQTLKSQTANTIFAAPNGSAGTPTFRAIAQVDLPGSSDKITSKCPSILSYGGDPTFTSDNATAFTTAQAASLFAGQTCVYLPAGHYKFLSSPATVIAAGNATGSASVLGDGPDATTLDFSTGTSGLAFTLNTQFQSIHVRQLSILAGSASNVTVGINVQQLQASVTNPANSAINDISFVNIRGNDGYASTNLFGFGINLSGVSNVNLVSVGITGSGGSYATNGVCIQDGGTSAIVPVVLNMTGVTANYCQYGFIYGPYLQGVTIAQSNMTGVGTGIYAASGVVGLDQLSVTGTQINANVNDIALNTVVAGVELNANDFYIAGTSTTAVSIAKTSNYSITGNVLFSIGTTNSGVVIGTYGAQSGVIAANQFNLFQTGIWLQTSSKFTTVRANSFNGVASPVLNSGTSNDTDTQGTVSSWNVAQAFTTINGTGAALPAPTPQAAAGTGATAVCKSTYQCDNLSGTILLTTGTAPTTGNVFAVTFATIRLFPPNCTVSGAGAFLQGTNTTQNLLVNVNTALTASMAYTVTYTCFGS